MRLDIVTYDKYSVLLPYSTYHVLLTVFIMTIHYISIISVKSSYNTLDVHEYYSGILITRYR